MTIPAARQSSLNNRSMPANVCCPNCWMWSEISSRTTCRRCGTALILPDGRSLDAALATVPVASVPPPPPSPEVAAGLVPPPPPQPAARLRGPGPDWVAVARWVTLGYGVLGAVGLVLVGLMVQRINIPITDPATGLTTVQTFNIGPAFAVAAVVVCAVAGLFAWLTRYTAARVVFLVLDLLAVVTAISQFGAQNRLTGTSTGAVGLFSLAVDLGYAGVLLMSLRPRPQPAYV